MGETMGRRRVVAAQVQAPRLVLLLDVLALTLFGLVMVYSSSTVEAFTDPDIASTADYLADQLLFVALGILCALAVWKFVPPRVWHGPFVWVVWAVAIALLVLTALFGYGIENADGTQDAVRWLSIGGRSFQPSEFAKIAFILAAARIMADYRVHHDSFAAIAQMSAFVLLPTVVFLTWLQSDLGSTMICVVGVLAVLWFGGMRMRWFFAVFGLIFAFGLVAMLGVDYRRARVLILADPWQDPLDLGYQLIHSFYALAQGGLFGVGLGNSRMKYLWLTASHTDFIYAVIGEELGLVGALFVVVLYLLFLYAGMSIAKEAVDSHGAILAGSLTLMIVFQAFLNIGFNIGILPTTGKTLPFVSYGGSSLLATYIMVGLILAVARDAATTSVYERRRENLRIVRAVDEERPRGTDGSRSRGASTGRARATGRSAAAPRFRATATQRPGRR